LAQNLLKDIFNLPKVFFGNPMMKRSKIMFATYPLHNAFYRTSGKKADPQQSHNKSKDTDNGGLDSDQAPKTACGPPETEEDNYHLGRLIYML
jgi:hypothetical protein